MTAKTTRKRVTSADPVTKYAKEALGGKIIAGPHVREACRRHLEDLEKAPGRGFFFDRKAAARAIGFYRDILRLNGGEFEGKPFELIGWQRFIVGSLFGWKDAEGFRRFRTAYIETGKGSGKSPLAAGIGLLGLVGDNEARAEIYAGATKKDQAMVLFRDAVAMVDQSPDLIWRLKRSGISPSVWNLAYLKNGSFFRPISAEENQSGPRPHIALLDEVHEHKSDYVIEMLKAGFKFRRQPMMVMITNSGTDKQSVCWNYHDYGAKVAAGQLQDDSFFAYICALDEGEDPFKGEKCWEKANPSLKHGLPGLKYLREQVHQARGMPSKESKVRRLNFCQWVEAETPWISGAIWFSCSPELGYDDEILYGRRCFGGLDLSSTQDLTSLVLLFEPTETDPNWRIKPYFWLPGDGLHEKAERDRVPYLAWRDAGWLTALPGRAINKLSVATRLAELSSMYEIAKVGYDRWRIEDLRSMADEAGLNLPELVPFGQGYKDMSLAVEEFESLLLGDNSRHDGNPVLTWCAANAVVVSDDAGNRKISKGRATGRVDGIVASIMAAGLAMGASEQIGKPGIVIL